MSCELATVGGLVELVDLADPEQLPIGASDLLAAPARDAGEEAALSARELASVLRRAGNALVRARGGPAAAPAPPSALRSTPAPSAEAIETERTRVREARDAFPPEAWNPSNASAPAFSMPLTARASPSGTWTHQQAARARARPASASQGQLRAAALGAAVGRPLPITERPQTVAGGARRPSAARARWRAPAPRANGRPRRSSTRRTSSRRAATGFASPNSPAPRACATPPIITLLTWAISRRPPRASASASRSATAK
ncbi:hypothetical protein T492DRAFT_907400, partial [Pavlovales sp. CCMP2436]